MEIILVQSAPWGVEGPPYSSAILSSIIKERGHKVFCYDLNIKLFNYCNSLGERLDWDADHWYSKDYPIKFYNRHYNKIDELITEIISIGAPIIGFTVQSLNANLTYLISKRIKKIDKNKIIIFGGPHCFRNCIGPDILEQERSIDIISLGESDFSLPRLLDKFDDNLDPTQISETGFAIRGNGEKIHDLGDHPLVENLDILPFADFSDFNLPDYSKRCLPIAMSRSCICCCTFCNERIPWRLYRHRSAENVFDEINFQIAKYPQINFFRFNDSLINGDIENLEKLCDLLIDDKVKIGWCSQTLIRKEMNLDFLKKLKRAGCDHLIYGFESGSNRILHLMKKPYTAEIAEMVIRNTYKAGIKPFVNIIIGFPGETEADFFETLNFLDRNRRYVSVNSCNLLMVMKGSYIYNNRDSLGILFPANDDGQMEWCLRDGANNYDIRKARLKAFQEIYK